MKQVVVIPVAAAALIGAAPAAAHGLIAHHPLHATKLQIERSQVANLKHAKYLCNRGRNATKRWGCATVRWLTKELNETRAALRPKVTDLKAWLCIHRFEGAWNANTGNGYYGGLQMDVAFQTRYGSDYVARWGTANNWPAWAQIQAARRARDSGRGYYPWPNTARFCGLI